MMYYICQSETCDFACRVLKADPDLELLSLRMRCPRCPQKINLSNKKEAESFVCVMREFTAKALYTASMGRGTPEEQLCSPELLSELLKGAIIMSLDLEAAGDGNRSIVNSMLVALKEEGTPCRRVFFATSTKGATIFKVEVD